MKKMPFIYLIAGIIAVIGVAVFFLTLRENSSVANPAPGTESNNSGLSSEPGHYPGPDTGPGDDAAIASDSSPNAGFGTEADLTPTPGTDPGAEQIPDYGQEDGQEPGQEPGQDNGREPGFTTEPAPEPIIAADLTDSLTVTLSDGRQPSVLLDRDYTSRIAFRSGAELTISAAENVYSMYLIWGLPPGLWSVTGVEAQIFGENGFIHEYVVLDAPGTELTISFPTDGAMLCDIYAFSEGTPPAWVQTWLPPHERANLLAFPTHADDEHLFFVGVLPYYSGERGYRVQVAYMTNHWNEPPRHHEMLNGLWAVGIRNYPVISELNDRYAGSLEQAESIYGFDSFVNFQVEQIRRFKPHVIVGHDLNGEYGHGTHMLGAHALREAVERAADSSRHAVSFDRYGIWNTPKLYLHLYPQNSIMMDWSIPLESFGGASAYEMAVAGYDAHKSQHRWAFAVPRPGSVSGHRFGLVRSLVGSDVIGGDMFENVFDERPAYGIMP